jgi:hypothetical protein
MTLQFTEPAVVCVYGPSGMGKTTDTLFSFPMGLFMALPGALKPSLRVVGWDPYATGQVVPVADLDAAVAALTKIKPGVFDAVVVDDLSLLAERTMLKLEAKHANSRSGFAMWNELRDTVIRFREAARACGLHVILNTHERQPETHDGTFFRGGPSLPSKTLTERIPHISDTVLRACADPTSPGAWKGVYKCESANPQWIMKDRHGCCPPTAPQNIAEIMRLAGYTIRRYPGLEWQEDWVEWTASQLATGRPEKEVMTELNSNFVDADPLHLRWVRRDGRHRFTLRKAYAHMITND